MLKASLNSLFPTLVMSWSLTASHDELINDLLKDIDIERQRDNKGLAKSNIFGWQSKSLNTSTFQRLATIIEGLAQQYALAMRWDVFDCVFSVDQIWANINPPGSMNAQHYHANAVLSGAQYLKVTPGSGDIVFIDPRPQMHVIRPRVQQPNSLNSSEIGREPKVGDLLLFPGWLEHKVEINQSKDERVSVAFNISIRSGFTGKPIK